MPFPEPIKSEAKKRANFCCVICKQPFVEVHHIVPEGEGGPDTLDNAAPLCGSCHDLFGGNRDKRKQIRQMRDYWWEICQMRNTAPDTLALNQKLDSIQANLSSNQVSQSQAIAEIKEAFVTFTKTFAAQISSAGTLTDISTVTGSSPALPQNIDDFALRVLSTLTQAGNISEGEIVAQLGVTSASVCWCLDALERAGLAHHCFDPHRAQLGWESTKRGQEFLLERGL